MTQFVHGDNLRQKELHRSKYLDMESRAMLVEIRQMYDQWRQANLALAGPFTKTQANDSQIITERVRLFELYKSFLDQQKYAEKFDSRSNLHSSVLEEFLYYLFQDLVHDFGSSALIGKSHTFKDLFFMPPTFSEMVRIPYATVERKDHDFVIGVTIEGRFNIASAAGTTNEQSDESTPATVARDSLPVKSTEIHRFDIPAVVIECKTYLDKTMLEGSSRAAEELKARNPNAIYIVVMEWLKLTESINLRKYQVDQIYILRKQRNTDREFRYALTYVKNPIYPEVVIHLFNLVRTYLTTDWEKGVRYGLERGWLL